MAHEESQREDLLGEATALVERIELRLVGDAVLNDDSVVAGFRADGAFSVFFGEDPAYHFNAAGELRRAYCDGLLIKATAGRLVSMRRVRTASETQLVRRELSSVEAAEFLTRMIDRLRGLHAQITSSAFEVVGQIPPETNVLGDVSEWIAKHDEVRIAARPNL
jgi:hypothetical protein